MKSFLWNGLILLSGLVVTMIVISLIQMATHYFIPLPAGIEIAELHDLESFLKVVPLSMMLLVELSYILGSFAGGFVMGKISKTNAHTLALLLGFLMTAVNVLNVLSIPHPLWMVILTMVTFIPFSLLGWYAARGKGKNS